MRSRWRSSVRLFAILRERAGARPARARAARAGATVADALAAAGREPGLDELLGAMPVRVALNREYVELETPQSRRATSWR